MNKLKKNNPILNVAKRAYTNNKKRNNVAIISIVLTTVLYTVIFSLGFGTIRSVENNNLRMAGSTAHGSLKYLTEEEYTRLIQHPDIYKVGTVILAGSIEHESLGGQFVQMDFMDEEALKMSFIDIKEGKMPEASNEIVLDTSVIKLLGGKAELGEKYILDCYLGSRVEQIEFTLCGLYEKDNAVSSLNAFVSKDFIAQYIRQADNPEENQYIGTYRADILFKNNRNVEDKLLGIMLDSGFQIQDVEYGMNWAYLNSTNSDNNNSIIYIFIFLILFIMTTGYLIISNIFHISVVNDIKFYGLLKTIGVTKKQIKRIIFIQAMKVCAFGIPFGLALGFVVAQFILPIVTTSMFDSTSKINFQPMIFIFSIFFVIITVVISCNKPASIAGKVSPIEGIKYVANSSYKSKEKSGYNGAKPYRMALSNLGRNKKRTILTVISIALALILMNTTYCIFSSFSIDKFVNKQMNVDFQIASNKYFKNEYSSKDGIPQDFVDFINKHEGIQSCGGIYVPTIEILSKYNGVVPKEYLDGWYENGVGGRVSVYAMDEFVLNTLKMVEGNFDSEKFSSGNYVLIGVDGNENDTVALDSVLYHTGEKIRLDYSNEDRAVQKEYEVMGLYLINNTNSERGRSTYLTIAMHNDELVNIDQDSKLMTYIFNVIEGYGNDFEKSLKEYTSSNPSMHYESKDTYKLAFQNLKKAILIMGSMGTIILIGIGIVNYINSIYTGVVSRRHEFAIMKSIGMEVEQLCVVLRFESFYYILFAIIMSFIASVLIIFGVIKQLSSVIWFLEFKFSIVPLVVAYGIMAGLAIILPDILVAKKVNSSIVEELKDSEY